MIAIRPLVLVLAVGMLPLGLPQTSPSQGQQVTIKRVFVGPFAAAKAARVEGEVRVRWEVDPDGSVRDYTIEGSPALKATVDTWAKQWIFSNPSHQTLSVETTFRFRIEPAWESKWGGQQLSGDLEHGFDIVGAPAYTETQYAPKGGYTPDGGFVPDSATAVKIAEALLIPVYGKKQIESERPFRATFEKDVWTVSGTLHCPDGKGGLTTLCFGGTAEVKLSKEDGRVLSMIHYK